jgi:hypothetical protein
MAVGEYMIGLIALNWADLDQIRFSPASRFQTYSKQAARH